LKQALNLLWLGFFIEVSGRSPRSFVGFFFIAVSLKAQNVAPPEASDALWSRIETQLAQQTSDTSFQFILPLVRQHCGQDKDCLFQNYFHLVTKLEHRFNLPAAIFVCDEIVKIAQFNGAIEEEAQAYLHNCRFQDALGNTRMAAFDIEQSLRLFKQVGDPRKVAMATYWKLRISLSHSKELEVSAEMEALLSEAKLQMDTGLLVRVHKFLAEQSYGAAEYGKTAEHLDALDAILEHKHFIKSDQYYKMFVYTCRGDIAQKSAHWEDAKRFYQNALRLSQSIPDRWVEIKCLQILAELDWELGNRSSAKAKLEQAHTLAEERNLEDLLINSFGVKVRFAEAEGQYEEALKFSKKMRKHELKWNSRASGSNAENYFLEVENENKKLELGLKKNQLRYSLIVAILILLLASGIFLAYRKQRDDKRKLSEQNTLIQRQSEQLKSLDAAKSHFFANVSHELRTPLALMLGPISSLLKEPRRTAKQTHLLQLAQKSSKQLDQLVTDILDLGKLEMGKMELNETPTEVAPFFRSYFAQFESLAESRQIDFSFDIAVGDEAVANLDQAKCRQILNNLLSNAFKFTPAGERVEAKLSLNNGTIQLIVADTGPGIHPDDLPHLFNRYFQTTRPDKPAEGGTGIGLALCYEYAQLFGGKIEVESTLGQGSLFRVMIPVKLADNPIIPIDVPEILASARVPEPAPIVAPAELVDKSKPTILVVEDNPDLQAYIRVILSEKYNIVTAENGQTAFSMMNDECRMMNAECRMMN
jgi:signal transduction histidine kinase